MVDALRRAAPAVSVSVLIGAAAAQAQPAAHSDFSDIVADWDIEGVAVGIGNTVICKMQKSAADGSVFAYILMVSVGSDGLNVVDAYITPSALPEDSSPKVAIFFDGKKATELTGGVKKGFLHADLAKLSTAAMSHIIELFKASKTLVEVVSLRGHSSEKTTVDLAGGDAAFDKRAECAKAVGDIGLERMRNAK